MPAGGGGGGAEGAPPGGGGGGGIEGAPAPGGGGGGGGGGGTADGAGDGEMESPGLEIAGTGGRVTGGGGGGATGLSCTGVADFEADLSSSMALRGRGGAMVPNRMLASCLALPPVGRSSSSSDESASEPAADQSSSSSGRARVLRSKGAAPVKVGLMGSCCVKRWNGFVDWAVVGGEVAWVGSDG